MGRRYSNINQGTELKQAQENLENYRKTRTTARSAKGIPQVKSSRPKTEVAIKPFDIEEPGLVIVSVTRKSLTKLEPILGTRVKKDQASLDAGVKIGGFKPARIYFFDPDSAPPAYVKSKSTKLNYIKYPGTNYSSPFGATGDNEEEAIAARTLKTAVLASTQKDFRRAWYSSEKHRV